MDIEAWLRELGLEKYLDLFREQAIDVDILTELSDADLREFAIPLGDRRRILKAANNLNPLPEASFQQNYEAERRQLTVMFCDLVGSTALSTEMDAEELRETLRAYQDACMQAIEPYGGTMARAYGDGLLIYFGYPVANEDEAARAVLAGFDIIEAVSRLPASPNHPAGTTLKVRIGVHTGKVVVGGIRDDDQLDPMGITGDAPNIAARLQDQASPNTVVVSDTTRRLAGKVAHFESIGERSLKGLPYAMPLYHSTPLDSVEEAAQDGVTDDLGMIGRDRELQQLLDAWHGFRAGNLRGAALSGPSGIGKSQIIAALSRELASRDVHTIKLRCSSLRVLSPFQPVAELFKRRLHIEPSDPAAERLRKLEAGVDKAGLQREHAVPLLAPILSISTSHKYPDLDMVDARRLQETVSVVVQGIRAMAENRQPLLVFEDLQWIDSSTREVLRQFMEAPSDDPVFVVCTYRPEFVSPWEDSQQVETINLGQLDDAAIRQMITHIAGDGVLGDEIISHIVTTTDGVPLFVEELTKSVIEAQKAGELPADLTNERLALTSIPDSLQDLLLARLDRLGDAKRIAQLGATIGREFSYRLLFSIADLDAPSLRRQLERLITSEFLIAQGDAANERFFFKHAMVQGAAYSTLLHSDRQTYHRRIAQALASEAKLSQVPQPHLLAHHFTEAGDLPEAIPQWLAAGEHAAERYAIPETISQLQTGLELLSRVEESRERSEMELKFQYTIAMPIASSRGYTSQELRDTLERARTLCNELGNPAQLFPALHGMVKFYLATADHVRTESVGHELLSIAEECDDNALRLEAHRNLGMTYAMAGRFVDSVDHCDRAMALYDPVAHQSHAQLYAVDPAVVALSFSAYSHWALGDAQAALDVVERAIAHANELNHPYSRAFALSNASTIYVYEDLPEKTLEYAQQSVEVSSQHGFPWWIGWSALPLGWALCKLGRTDEGFGTIRLGLDGYAAAGVLAGRPLRYALYAECLRMNGDHAQALKVVDSILDFPELGMDMYQSEVHRMRGELLLELDSTQVEAARESYQTGLEAAQAQHAIAFEKRCRSSLASLDNIAPIRPAAR